MDFSKKGTTDKYKRLKSPYGKMNTKASVTALRLILVFGVILTAAGLFAGYGMVKGIIDNAPDVNPINVIPTGYSTTIFDNNGKEIQKLVGSDANRIYVTLDKIPKNVQEAFISIEDARFWEHDGIDVRGIFRAAFVGLTTGDFSEGASTLTQQLLKNQIFEGGNENNFLRKVERKLQEQYLAIKLENELSKEEILEYYLNTINLGQNTLGVQAASKRYFNKNISDLTLSEAAVLAGITKNPVGNNPLTNPENNQERRTIILKYMLEQGKITQKEMEDAQTDDVYNRIETVNEEYFSTAKINSYFVDELINQVIDDLIEKKGYSQTQAVNAVYREGLSIYTTQDRALQKICNKVTSNKEYYPVGSKMALTYRLSILKADNSTVNYSEGHLRNYIQTTEPDFSLLFSKETDADPYIEKFKKSVLSKGDKITGETKSFSVQPQVSFVLMDQQTGQVKAIVGGRGKKIGNLTLNRATSTTRQPGSTFKILSSYLPALDTMGETLATVEDDAPYSYPNGTSIRNWDGRHRGLTSLREGIYDSMNILAVKTLANVTPQVSFDYLQKLGFTTLVDNYVDSNGSIYSDINLPMALGGLTKGVTNLELTSAYAAIANKGVYTEPIFYTKILDHDGNILIDNTPSTFQAMKESTAWLLTNAMEDVVKKGTGKAFRLTNVDMPVSGKTGTTTSTKDLWFSGFTPYYTASVWVGFDNNETMSDTSTHKVIWRTIMEEIHKTLPTKSFKRPNSIVQLDICATCGNLAIEAVCDRALGGSAVKSEYFDKNTVPSEKCNCHVKLRICSASDKPSSDHCPESYIKTVVYLIKKSDSADMTEDAPYILPSGLEGSICTVHRGNPVQPVPEEEENTEDNSGYTEDTGNTEEDTSSEDTENTNPDDGNADDTVDPKPDDNTEDNPSSDGSSEEELSNIQ